MLINKFKIWKLGIAKFGDFHSIFPFSKFKKSRYLDNLKRLFHGEILIDHLIFDIILPNISSRSKILVLGGIEFLSNIRLLQFKIDLA